MFVKPMIELAQIDELTGGKLGTFDAPCPLCSAGRSTAINRRKKVLRVWRVEENFATFHCVHCGERGHVHDRDQATRDPFKLAKARAEAAERDRVHKAERLSKARWLWSARKPIKRTIAETYLRSERGYGGLLPATLGFLPKRHGYPPALIAAFGLAHEPAPGELEIGDNAVRGVHLTRLRPDGRKADGDKIKIMIGSSGGSPIVIAPVNDLGGLAVAEGIEDALSVRDVCGLGVWASGAASRLPALADAVPDYVESVSILVDTDEAGARNSNELARRLRNVGVEVRLIAMGGAKRSAA